MTKIVTKTVTIVQETVAVSIPGTDRFVLVYYRKTTGKKDGGFVVMKALDYEKAKTPDDIKNYTFCPPHLKKSGYKASFQVFTLNQIEAMKNGKMYWYDADKTPALEFGQEIPENCVVLGYSNADCTIYTLDQKIINLPVIDTYLDESFDIRAMLKNEKDNPDIFFIPESDYRPDVFIYYVPGNGYTLRIGIRLTDEQYQTWRGKKYCERYVWLIENTVLGKYKRPKRRDG